MTKSMIGTAAVGIDREPYIRYYLHSDPIGQHGSHMSLIANLAGSILNLMISISEWLHETCPGVT